MNTIHYTDTCLCFFLLLYRISCVTLELTSWYKQQSVCHQYAFCCLLEYSTVHVSHITSDCRLKDYVVQLMQHQGKGSVVQWYLLPSQQDWSIRIKVLLMQKQYQWSKWMPFLTLKKEWWFHPRNIRRTDPLHNSWTVIFVVTLFDRWVW